MLLAVLGRAPAPLAAQPLQHLATEEGGPEEDLRRPALPSAERLSIVATDTDRAGLRATRAVLERFCAYHGLEAEPARDAVDDAFSSREAFPLAPGWPEVVVAHGHFERVAQLLPPGALVCTRIPRPRGTYEVHRRAREEMYQRFGSLLASRTDWAGVFVVAEDRAFRQHSRLEWELLARIDAGKRRVDVLRWARSAKPQLRAPAEDPDL